MSQSRKLTRKEKIALSEETTKQSGQQVRAKTVKNRLALTLNLIAAALGVLLYIQTVQYAYTRDDYLSMKENFVVRKGISGIGTILSTSYHYGYWASADELYRPLSLIMFAIEWQFFPDSPALGHFINVLLYALTSVLLFNLLRRLFADNLLVPFLGAVFFIAHPAHTEVVANIKSRDEILCFLLSLVSIRLLLDYIDTNKAAKLWSSAIVFFLSLLAKESSLTLLAVIPLLLFVFRSIPMKRGALISLPLVLAAAAYTAIRFKVLGAVTHTKLVLMLDNPIIAAPDVFSHIATAMYVLGRYLLILVVPLHLSVDYSYREIPIFSLTDYRVLIAAFIYLSIAVYAIYKIKERSAIAFSILYYLLTISIASNLVVVIGTIMADRLLYMPSLGFSMIAASLLNKLQPASTSPQTTLSGFVKQNSKPLAIAFVVLTLYSFRIIERNPIWQNDMSIYMSGLKDSPNSSRVHYYAAMALKNKDAKEEKDPLKQIAVYNHAIKEFGIAIELYSQNFDAYRERGDAYFRMGDSRSAMKDCDKALEIVNYDARAMNLKGVILFEQKNYTEAMVLFKEALKIDPRYSDALKNLGSYYGTLGQIDRALVYFDKSLEYEKDEESRAGTFDLMATAYKYKGDHTRANSFYAKSRAAKAAVK